MYIFYMLGFNVKNPFADDWFLQMVGPGSYLNLIDKVLTNDIIMLVSL